MESPARYMEMATELANRIDRDLAYLAPERSKGEYLIEKDYIDVGHWYAYARLENGEDDE